MKSLLLGVLAIVVIGIGGLVYRNAVEYPNRQIVCPFSEKTCPDGTSVERFGSTCDFPACPSPNVELASFGIAFALPEGFTQVTGDSRIGDNTVLYRTLIVGTSTDFDDISISMFTIAASSTALATIQQTAIGGTSGEPVSPTRFTAKAIGERTFTVVPIDRFEAIVVSAYYWKRGSSVLRFEAVDRDVVEWMSPDLVISTLPAHAALERMLTTLQGQ
jgi:hypothetical protein